MNIAIVDDRKEDREKLNGILLKYAADSGEKLNIEHFDSAEALLDNYQPFLYAILFLECRQLKLFGKPTEMSFWFFLQPVRSTM